MGRIAEAFQGLLAGDEGLVEWSVKSEEFYLYPVRQLFFGELCDKRLLDGHEGIFRSVRKIADLTKIKSWTDAEYDSALPNLDPIYGHPISCGVLGLWIKRLPVKDQEELFQEILAVREQGTKLFEHYRERLAG